MAVSRGRPRLYPVEVARDGAPVFTMRLTPELLAFVKAQGGSTFVRGLIEAAMDEHQDPREDEPEADEPCYAIEQTWVICLAPARERRRLGLELETLWILVHRASDRVVGLLPLRLDQLKHLRLIMGVRFPTTTEAQLQEPAWLAFEARLRELNLLVDARVERLHWEEPEAEEPVLPTDPRHWSQLGWGVERASALEAYLADIPLERAWYVGHVPSRRPWGIFSGRFEEAVKLAQGLAERFGSIEKLSWEKFSRKRGLAQEFQRLVESGQLRPFDRSASQAQQQESAPRRRRKKP